MSAVPRRTLAGAAEVAGVGLFTGKPARVRMLPAAPGAGVMFRRADVAGSPAFPATAERQAAQPAGIPARNTILGGAGEGPGGTVMTVEHILSALVGCDVTDVLLEVNGPEIPIGDGSAAPFVRAIAVAGVVEHGTPAEPLRIGREIVVEAGAGRIVARPREAAGCSYRYELDYGPGAPIPAQSAAFGAGDDYGWEVAPARTFCLQAEAKQMQAMGLFTHLSPREMLVIGPGGPIENSLRFEDEPARHKLLDLIGDLSLVGRPLQVDVVATRAGHALNHAIARALSAAAC